jgi:hypothetical protein
MQGGPQCPSQRVYPQRGQEARNEDLTAIRGDLGTCDTGRIQRKDGPRYRAGKPWKTYNFGGNRKGARGPNRTHQHHARLRSGEHFRSNGTLQEIR